MLANQNRLYYLHLCSAARTPTRLMRVGKRFWRHADIEIAIFKRVGPDA